MEHKFFITGATGFLGGAVLAQMLAEDRKELPLLLVRAGSSREGLQRIVEQMRLFEVPENQIARLSSIDIVVGDLGDSAWHQDERLQGVTHIINSAAVASF